MIQMLEVLLSLIVAATGMTRNADPTLNQLAQTRVQEVVAGEYGGGHRYLEELNDLAPKYHSWGEVIGWNQWYESSTASARNVVRGWMQSPNHRAILTDTTYNRIGCAISAQPDAEYTYVCILANTFDPMPMPWLIEDPPADREPSVDRDPSFERAPAALLPNTAMPAVPAPAHRKGDQDR